VAEVTKIIVAFLCLSAFACDQGKGVSNSQLHDQLTQRFDSLAAAIAELKPVPTLQAPKDCFFVEGVGAGQNGSSYLVQMLCPGGKPAIEIVPLIKQATAKTPMPMPTPAPKK